MRTVGFNVEWSQELAVGGLPSRIREGAAPRRDPRRARAASPRSERDAVFDVSVGYDLEGIRIAEDVRVPRRRSRRERRSSTRSAPRSRRELPVAPPAHWADVPCDARLSDSVTLSTFHGCPADEIDAIGRYLLAEQGLHTIVKLNPTLLGYEEVEEILHGRLGYTHIALRRSAFDKDLHWDGALSHRARPLGRGRAPRTRLRVQGYEHARRRQLRATSCPARRPTSPASRSTSSRSRSD